jgi:hypothetical protein
MAGDPWYRSREIDEDVIQLILKLDERAGMSCSIVEQHHRLFIFLVFISDIDTSRGYVTSHGKYLSQPCLH